MDIIFDSFAAFSIGELLSYLAAEIGFFEVAGTAIESINLLLGEEGITALSEIVNGTASDTYAVNEIELSEQLKPLFTEEELEAYYGDLRLDLQPVGNTNLKGFISRVGVITKNVLKNGGYQSLNVSKSVVKDIINKSVQFARNHATKVLAPSAIIGAIGGTAIYNKLKSKLEPRKNIDSHLIDEDYVDVEPDNFGYSVEN